MAKASSYKTKATDLGFRTKAENFGHNVKAEMRRDLTSVAGEWGGNL